MKQLTLNFYEAIKWLFGYRQKAMPLTDNWLYMEEKELLKHVEKQQAKVLKVSKTIAPEERNSSSLKSVKERRLFNTTIKNTLKN